MDTQRKKIHVITDRKHKWKQTRVTAEHSEVTQRDKARNYLGEHAMAAVLGRELSPGCSAVDAASHTESKTWLLV